MFVQVPAMYVGSRQNQFTNEQGQLVNFYRVTLIDDEGNPLQLPCSEAVYNSAQYIERKSDVVAELSIGQSQRGVTVRVSALGLS